MHKKLAVELDLLVHCSQINRILTENYIYYIIAKNRTLLICNVIAGRILRSIFRKWRVKASSNWNISEELCSGAAIDSARLDGNRAFNPGIKCYCSSTTCDITELKVYELDVVGVSPDELWN